MSLLNKVSSGKQIGAQIHVIAGHNGVGKTTWAAQFPNVLIIDLEDGSAHLDVKRIESDKVGSLTNLRSLIAELATTEHGFKTIAIDSVEALEDLIFKAICKSENHDSIEDFGYGKGYAMAREVMRDVMGELIALKKRGITVILIAHTQIKAYTDPANNQTYDRVVMRANDKIAAVIRDLADNIFYASFKVFTAKDGNKTRAFGDGQRVMYTQPRPGYDAKNRLELPLELPLSYEAFDEACNAQPEADVAAIAEDIRAIAEKLDESLKAKVDAQLKKFKDNPAKLKDIKNRLMKYVAA